MPRLYIWLLRAFPESFRREHGRQMEEVFRRMHADPGVGRIRRMAVWCRAIADILWHAGVERMKQIASVRDRSRAFSLRHLPADIRYMARGVAANPGYAAAFVLTLGLGIGANTAIFSVVNGVLLRPLPHDRGDELVYLQQPATMAGVSFNATFSNPEIDDYSREASSLTGFARLSGGPVTMVLDGEPRRIGAAVVSGNYFDVMGLRAHRGRTFTSGDDGPDAVPSAVLTHAFWHAQFGADPNVVGRTVSINDRVVTIVGVVEPAPQYPNQYDVFVNTVSSPHHLSAEMTHTRTHRMTELFARLAGNATLETARTEVKSIGTRLAAAYPEAYPERMGYGIELTGFREALVRDARSKLYVLLGTAAFVLIIACANVANLTLARVVRREREFSVRTALGAGQGRLRAQLLTESVVLALVGAGLGIAVAGVGLDLLVAMAARYTPRAVEIGIDAPVLGFATVVAVGAAMLFAWAPALPGESDFAGSLAETGRSTPGRRRRRLQRALVVAQLAVSFILLIGAGLLVQTLVNLHRVDPGFDPENVLTMTIPFPSRMSGPERNQFFDRVTRRLEAHPGVRSAAVAMVTPLRSSPMSHDLRIEGWEPEPGAAIPQADFRSVGASYFRTVGMPVVRGRTFDAGDDVGAPDVAIISAAMADYYFPNGDALGRRIAWRWNDTDAPAWKTIVGVVSDSRDYGLDQTALHAAFQPYAQEPFGNEMLVRTVGDADVIARDVVAAVREQSPDSPVENVRTLEQLRSDAVAPQRLNASLFGAFALLAVVIAAVGVSGVLAFSVSQRTHEFGVRLTLGADRTKVMRMILGEGASLAALGLALGAAGAFVLSRFLSNLLFGITPTDPTTFVAVAAVLMGVTILASVLPARRAVRVDPIEALRSE